MEAYYTPDIMDIRVGYECEMSDIDKDDWRSLMILSEDIHRIGTYWKLRTPYLTKEQIEAEGWEYIGFQNVPWGFSPGDYRKGQETFKKGGALLMFAPEIRRVVIFNHDWSRETTAQRGFVDDLKFNYICPSINEFRFVNKLFGI